MLAKNVNNKSMTHLFETSYLRHPQIHPEWVQELLRAFPQGAVFFDLETTGLSPLIDSIIELSALKVEIQGITSFSTLINPLHPITENSTAIHGISDMMVANAPTIVDVLPAFNHFIGKLPLIAHNAKFDSGFLAMAAHKIPLNLPDNPVYCSLQLSKKAFPELKSHRLGSLVVDLNIPLNNHHRALDDSLACLLLVAKGLKKYQNDSRLLNDCFLYKLSDYREVKSFDIPESLQGIGTKIHKKHLIFIKYRGGSFKNQFRPILPTSFLPMPGGNVLYALCLHSGVYKSFGINKITDWREMTGDELNYWAKEMSKFDKKSDS